MRVSDISTDFLCRVQRFYFRAFPPLPRSRGNAKKKLAGTLFFCGWHRTGGEGDASAKLRCGGFCGGGGGRIGFAYESVDMEFSGYDSVGSYSGSADDSDVGFLYGVGVGGQIDFSDFAALVFGIDYVGMTAEPEVGGIKTDEQAYMMFSVGYKHKF